MIEDITHRYHLNIRYISVLDHYVDNDGVSHWYAYIWDGMKYFEISEESAVIIQNYWRAYKYLNA